VFAVGYGTGYNSPHHPIRLFIISVDFHVPHCSKHRRTQNFTMEGVHVLRAGQEAWGIGSLLVGFRAWFSGKAPVRGLGTKFPRSRSKMC